MGESVVERLRARDRVGRLYAEEQLDDTPATLPGNYEGPWLVILSEPEFEALLAAVEAARELADRVRYTGWPALDKALAALYDEQAGEEG